MRKWLKQALAAESLQPSTRSKAGPVTAAELQGLGHDLAQGGPGPVLRQRSAVVLGSAAAGASGARTQTAGC